METEIENVTWNESHHDEEFNITKILNYDITGTVYSKLDSLSSLPGTFALMSRDLHSKLRHVI